MKAGRSAPHGKWLVLGLLILVGLTNYIDRLSISVLQVPIRAELGLSDTQMGALTGLSFSLIYTIAALPIARLADRHSPKAVIILSLVVWNLMTILCGLAAGFVSIALLRMGVAIGEAGCGPATQSLLSRHFEPHRRGLAIAIWQMVFPLGAFIGVAVSGWLSDHHGWRGAFTIMGLGGLAVAPLIALLLSPGKAAGTATSAEGNRAAAAQSFAAALGAILQFRSFRLLLLGGFIAAIPLNACLNWNAPFYSRTFDKPLAEVSFYVGLIAGLGGAAGMLAGGLVADRLGHRDQRVYFWLPAASMLVVPPLALLQYRLVGSFGTSLGLGLVLFIALNGWMPPQAAIAQTIVQPANRALAAACILVTAGVGGALGPFVTGLLSDQLVRLGVTSRDGLGTSLVLVSLSAFVAAALFAIAGLRLPSDIRRCGNPRPDAFGGMEGVAA